MKNVSFNFLGASSKQWHGSKVQARFDFYNGSPVVSWILLHPFQLTV